MQIWDYDLIVFSILVFFSQQQSCIILLKIQIQLLQIYINASLIFFPLVSLYCREFFSHTKVQDCSMLWYARKRYSLELTWVMHVSVHIWVLTEATVCKFKFFVIIIWYIITMYKCIYYYCLYWLEFNMVVIISSRENRHHQSHEE